MNLSCCWCGEPVDVDPEDIRAWCSTEHFRLWLRDNVRRG